MNAYHHNDYDDDDDDDAGDISNTYIATTNNDDHIRQAMKGKKILKMNKAKDKNWLFFNDGCYTHGKIFPVYNLCPTDRTEQNDFFSLYI